MYLYFSHIENFFLNRKGLKKRNKNVILGIVINSMNINCKKREENTFPFSSAL